LDLLEDTNSSLPEGLKVVAVYISGTIPKPRVTKTEKLIRWEGIDAQSLSTILMNITSNVQAGLDCSSTKAAWDSLGSQYTQTDPIVQNISHTCLHAKHFIEGSMETLLTHIAELQRLREACIGLSVTIMDSQSMESSCYPCVRVQAWLCLIGPR